MECQVFKTAHPIPTFGLVAEGNKKFVYTSDTSWEDKLVDLCRHAGILLCEASLAEADAHLATKGHLTAAQAGLLAAPVGGFPIGYYPFLAGICSRGFGQRGV